MANFLDDLSVYNAKAALVISQVVADGNTEKANMMSSLKSTANDTTLSETIRLNALTALINLGSLLDIPLPPYFPLTTTYANTQTYVGIHDDLTGLQGGAPGEYYHVTLAERNSIANAATIGDISFANLTGNYTDNASLVSGFAGKQDALSGTGFVKISGTTISYDNSTYLSSISGIAAGGELSGTYPSPTLSNAAVISKVLTGFTGTSLPIQITSADSILSAMQKLNNNIASLIVSPSGVASVALTTNSSTVFTTTTTAQTGAATLDVSLNTQTASKFLASPTSASGTPTFRAFSSTDLPDSGATAGAYGSSSLIPQITVDAKGRITAISTVAAAAGGQVNSVTLTIPSIFGPVTNTGSASAVNLTYVLANQTTNYVWAGPASGAAAVPSFRALVADDIPSLPTSKITGLSSILSGYLTDSLSDGSIWIGNASNAAVQRVLSGDVTISNLGVTEIGAAKVQYSMIQDVTTQTLLGRYDAVDGEVQQITLSGDFLLNSGTGVLSLSSPVSPVVTTKGDLLGHDLTAQQRVPSSNVDGDILLVNNSATGTYTDLGLNWVTMSGDATISATGAITIANGAVSLGKMANLANNRIIGNVSGGPLAPSALTGTQVTAMLDQFSTTAKGLVPAASGVNDTTKYLRGDGSWQAITGTGTVTDVSVVNANGFDGSVATSTSTPAITLTTTVTGILKGNGTAMSAAVAGTDIVTPGQITNTTGAGSGLEMASNNLLGRVTSSAGPIEAIAVNSSLSLSLPSGVPTLGLNLGNGNVFTAQQQMPSIRLNGSTSGFVSFEPPATAGAQAYTLPTAFPGTGTTGYLTSNDAGVLAWASAAGTTTNAVTFNNSGSGDASGTTFNGSAARTISYNTIGAQALNANLTGLSGLTYVSGSPLVRMTGAGTFTLDGATYVTGTATQYAVLIGGAGNTVASLGAGTTTGQLLQYNSGSNNPSWSAVVYPTSTTQDRILFSSSNNVIGQITAPSNNTFLQYASGSYSWTAAVTSLTLSTGIGGIVSNSGTATAPVLSVSGTLGGLVYFDSATSWDSTGALDQGELIVGGGSGAPSTINNGASGTILKSNGTGNNPSFTSATYPSTTQANRILFSSSNDVVDQIAAPTTASTFLQWNGSSFTWAAAGGGSTAASLTINNSGTGASSGATFDGSTAVTISSNTILPAFVANKYLKVNSGGTALSWEDAGSGSGTVSNSTNANVLAIYSSPGTTVSPMATITASRALASDTNGLPVASATTATELGYLSGATGTIGTGNLVFSASPTFTGTPVLSTATATSINKVAITAPATSATLTIADGKTLTISESLTLSASSSASVAFGGGGTVAYIGTSNSWAAGVKQTFAPNATSAGINVGSFAGDPSVPANGDLVYNSSTNALRAYINGGWVSLGGGVTTPVSVANGGTGLTSGTQGGIPWFNGTLTMASSALLTANDLMIGGGAGAAPSTITTGTGVLAALGVAVGTANAFVVNGGALGTPSSGTLTACTGLPLTGTTGTLPVARGGTNVTGTPTNGQLLIGNGTGYTLAALTQGAGITITNGVGSISIASAASAPTLNQLQAASAANTPINSANFAQEWQWNALAGGNGFFLSSTSTAAASNTQTLFRVSLSGTNATSTQTTYAAQISNSHAGTASTNVALSLSATSGTTINYALDVLGGIVRMAASTASVPHMVFTPGTAALTATTNGMLSYATVSSNSSFYLYKDSALTKLITLDRNPDFATGSGNGVVVADVNGTLTKSADLTALGIFSVHANTGNITTNLTETTMIGTSLVGSTTLPANFFGVGKTVRIYASGTVDNASNDDTTIRFKLGGTTIGTFSIADMHDTTANDFVMEAYIICNASGASGTVRVGATFFIEGTTPSGEHTWYMPVATQTGTINTTNSLALDITNQWAQTGCTMVVNFMTCYYLN